ncbi:MAG: hypothetical protein ABR564_02120 [Candidatus Dormibacteria bacterium]
MVLTTLAAVVAVMALSRPDLGEGPAGARHGGTPEAIATAVAVELGRGLLTAPHAVAVLSERDLTVVARERNPQRTRFRDPEARVRQGLVVITAAGSAGPFDVTTVAHVRVGLTRGAAEPRLSAAVTAVEVGRLPIPDWARQTVDPRGADSLALDRILDSSPAFRILRANVDCVAAVAEGVRLGVHRPGTAADPQACATL